MTHPLRRGRYFLAARVLDAAHKKAPAMKPGPGRRCSSTSTLRDPGLMACRQITGSPKCSSTEIGCCVGKIGPSAALPHPTARCLRPLRSRGRHDRRGNGYAILQLPSIGQVSGSDRFALGHSGSSIRLGAIGLSERAGNFGSRVGLQYRSMLNVGSCVQNESPRGWTVPSAFDPGSCNNGAPS